MKTARGKLFPYLFIFHIPAAPEEPLIISPAAIGKKFFGSGTCYKLARFIGIVTGPYTPPAIGDALSGASVFP